MSGWVVEPLAFPVAPHPRTVLARRTRSRGGADPRSRRSPRGGTATGSTVWPRWTLGARVADLQILRALDWRPGDRLDIRARNDVLIVQAHPEDVFSITNQGHLRVPASARRWLGVTAGERVFLAADLSARRLIVYSPAALDRILAQSSHACSPEDVGHER